MKVLEFGFKNLLSYGNKLQTFKFGDDPKLILVSGENGHGKSAIKEALTISVYGKSAIRKMKDIPNWLNQNAYTYVKFITNNGDIVEIDRGISPNFSNIKINEAPHNLPDKRKVDEFIEDDLARIPFTVFCNTISLSFDDFKSFVNLSTADKRKIVDRIFGIDILSDMRSIVKENLKENKRELDLLNSQIFRNESTLSNSITQLDLLNDKLSKKKESKSDELNSDLASKQVELEQHKSKYNEWVPVIANINKQIEDIRSASTKTRLTISDLSDKLDLYKNNRCPHCLNDLTGDASIKTKELIEAKKLKLEKSLPDLTKSITKLTTDLNSAMESRDLAKSDYSNVGYAITKLNEEIASLIEEDQSDETSSINEIIKSIKSEISKDTTESIEYSSQVELYSTLDDLLSDGGIKKSLIDKIIPTLNNRIAEISQKLEFKFQFEFDNEFDPIINYLGLSISPESLSTGQRKKMNLIVLLAFIELIKMKHSNTNVLFLDEIFSGLDKNNVYKAIEILKDYSERYNLTIFVVSHEYLPEEFFNSTITVTQTDHFSEMHETNHIKRV
jgi:DNA repair exonuclease SbcCD ATPase subunit